jgi:hypothetical protein
MDMTIITWTFDKPARVGQFINGDYYVVGPVTVTLIDPKPLWGDEIKQTINIRNAGGMDWTKAKRGEFGRQGYVMQARFVREMWDAWRNALPPTPDGHGDSRAEETWK